MIKKIVAAAALASLLGSAALASESVKLTDETTQQIRQTLTEQGYEVGKIKIDDGLYEAYARKDGKKYEIYLNAAMEVVRTKLDD